MYRVSNNGFTGYTPMVKEIEVFSDQGCSKMAVAKYVDDSGTSYGMDDGSVAFDGKYGTQWRPECSYANMCFKNEAWVSFSTYEEARCIVANNLGKDAIGTSVWNNGINVELQNSDGSWRMVMTSHENNSAVLGILTKHSLCDCF